MNQMMGASATALSEILGKTVDISTPTAIISDGDVNVLEEQEIDPDDYICTVTFTLTIDGVINSKFVTLLDMNLAARMADAMLKQYTSSLNETTAESAAPPSPLGPQPDEQLSPVPAHKAPAGVAAPVQLAKNTDIPVPDMPTASPASGFAAPPEQQPQQQYPQQLVPPPPGGFGPLSQAPPMSYQTPPPGGQYLPPPPQYYYPPPPPPQQMPRPNQPYNPLSAIDTSKFTKEQIRNLQLLMNVPMDVSIEVGSAMKRIDEILDFSQGTVFELDRAASAPVDIVVNGNLIAKGEVVVVDDNFAIKIIEINQANMTDMLSEKVS